MRRELERVFAYRHRTLRSDLEVQARYSNAAPMSVAVSGATGLVGSALTAFLSTAGHRVLRLVRKSTGAPDEVLWHPEEGVLEPEKLEGLHAVVHLAGENIAAGRWTEARKKEIRRSRRLGTSRLIESLARLQAPPSDFLCASAIGYYGDTGSQLVDENSAPGGGFLGEVCDEWEQAAQEAESFARRVVRMRFGVVLTPAGGALAKMLPPFRLGAGGVIGPGDQYMSWISLDDAIGAILHCLATPDIDGPVNFVAPQACTNRELTKTLGRVLRRPTFAPLPAPAVKLLFGEMGEAMLLASTRVRPSRLLDSGFAFARPDLENALRHCLGRSAAPGALTTSAPAPFRAA